MTSSFVKILPPARVSTDMIPAERIESRIHLIRGQKVLLDRDLAEFYGVETRVLNQAVGRNIERFPDDFMFKLTREEIRNLSQFVISSGFKHSPRVLVFTEQGVAMLSGLLNTPRAVAGNVGIMRAFVRLRQMIAGHAELAHRLAALEKRYDIQFKAVFDAIRDLMEPPADPAREIDFHTLLKKSRKAKIKT